MKTLYIECAMGCAGDMLTAALYELLSDGQKAAFLEKMNGLGLPGVRVAAEAASTCGIAGTHMAVTVHGQEEGDHDHDHHHDHGHGHHHHASPDHIRGLIDGMDLPEAVKEKARGVYDAISLAEAKAHGCPVGEVHYHEVGALDAVADVVGACYALWLLAPERVTASPVHVGSGTVRCAHGVMPVPAPATANLLTGVPAYGGEVLGELCTPTGAALLVNFAQSFGPMPPMRLLSTGCGVGRKVFDRPNCVRAMLGEGEEGANGEILELVFWITIAGAQVPSALLSEVLFWGQDRLTDLFTWLHAPQWLHGALVLGAYRTLAWVTAVMLPPMAIFFPLFTLLEDLGYLPRVAFVLDHAFQKAGSCGKQALTM